MYLKLFGRNILEVGLKSGQFISHKNIKSLMNAMDYGTFQSVFKTGAYAEANMLKLFMTIPEVFAPVDRIADGVASGKFQLCKIKRGKRTDEIVEDNAQWNKLVEKPNWQESLYDLIYTAVVYELVCGNRYFYPHTAGTLRPRFENISSLWLLPPQFVTIKERSSRPKFYKTTTPADLIDYYEYNDDYEQDKFKPEQIYHEAYLRTGEEDCFRDSRLKGVGPLQAADKPISNLVAVYTARNVIYVKRGALGFIVTEQGDADGKHALTKLEKEELLNDFNDTYGLAEGKSPVGLTRFPMSFVRTAMSISELEPFKECEADMLAIMHVLRVPKEAMATMDGAKYENQQKAIANFYRDVIIPKGESMAQILTKVLSLEAEGLYIRSSYDHIEVLQEDKKLKSDVDWKNNETYRVQFLHGQITLNEWREKFGYDTVSDAIYNKTILQMDEEELARIMAILKIKSVNNEQQNQGQAGQAQSE